MRRIEQLNVMFWFAQPFVALNFLIKVINVFVTHNQAPILFIKALNTLCCLSVLWAICKFRFQKRSRWVFVLWYLTNTILNLSMALTSDPDSFLYNKVEYQNFFLSLTVDYVLLMSFLSYCEFKISCVIYLPTYLIACALVSQAEGDVVLEARNQIS